MDLRSARIIVEKDYTGGQSICAMRWIVPIVLVSAMAARSLAATSSDAPASTNPTVNIARMYDVRDLIIPIPDFNDPPQLGVQGLPNPPAAAAASQPAKPALDATGENLDRLAERIRQKFEPDQLSTLRKQGALKITASRQSHEQIEQWLQQRREDRSVQVAFDTRFITGKGALDFLANTFGNRWQEQGPGTKRWRGFLNPTESQQMLLAAQLDKNSTLLTAPRITTFDGQRAYVKVARATAFVGSFKASGTQPGEFEPVTNVLESGALLDVRGTVTADRRAAKLEVRPSLCSLLELKAERWAKAPPDKALLVQLPQLRKTNLDVTVTLPDNLTALFLVTPTLEPAGAHADAPTLQPVLIAVRAKVIVQRAQPAKK
jgi:hypothetical protein